MGINYEKYEKKKDKLMFSDVEENQFFYDIYDCLCQKADNNCCVVITEKLGSPRLLLREDTDDFEIKAKCKKVKSISIEIEE